MTGLPGRSPVAVAAFASGEGRTISNLVEAFGRGLAPARLVLVVVSRPGAGAIDRAREHGVPVEVIDRKAHADDAAWSEAATRAVEAAGADLVCLAGFLHRYVFPPGLHGRVLNIHPALLPRFGGKGCYGLRVHRAVLAAGDAVSGCTVHFADLAYDRGPSILRREVPVLPDDTPETLAARVREAERVAYPEAIRLVASGLARAVPPGGGPA